MTLEEMLQIISNHASEIRGDFNTAENVVKSVMNGWQPPGYPGSLKAAMLDLMANIKANVDDVVAAINQWPS